MLDADDLTELRALQARAYGRHGELSSEEADRLAELQVRSAGDREKVAGRPGVSPAEPVVPPTPRDRAAFGVAAESLPLPTIPGPAPDDDDAAAQARPSASALSSVRASWRPLALAAAVVLALGVGIGWLTFGRVITPSIALSPEQQEWQTAILAEGVYDSGSVRAIAAEEGVVVWTATKDAQKDTCIILSNGERTRPSCQPTEVVEEDGIFGQLLVEISEVARREVMASLFFAPSGEPVVRVDSWDQTPGTSSITYATEEETKIAAGLVDDGFDPNSIWVIGYDRDVPVWTATELESQTQCLIHGGSTSSSPRVCADPQTMMEQESGLVLNIVDPLTGETTTFETSPNTGPSYLVITRNRGETGAGDD